MKPGAWCWLVAALFAAHAGAAAPVIGLIIDDLGDRHEDGLRVIALPGPIACAYLPGTPYGARQAWLAHENGKEVLLHFPLQPLSGKAHPQAITERSGRAELVRRLREDLAALPFISGVNTHQGSLLSQKPQPMNWLMAELKAQGGLYFVDSYTTPHSVALSTAQSWGLQTARRQVFLDDARSPEDIRAQWVRLIAKAQREGTALGIGHPYPETIAVLQRELPQLARYGVRLAAPSELIRLQRANKMPPQYQQPPGLSQTIASAATARSP